MTGEYCPICGGGMYIVGYEEGMACDTCGYKVDGLGRPDMSEVDEETAAEYYAKHNGNIHKSPHQCFICDGDVYVSITNRGSRNKCAKCGYIFTTNEKGSTPDTSEMNEYYKSMYEKKVHKNAIGLMHAHGCTDDHLMITSDLAMKFSQIAFEELAISANDLDIFAEPEMGIRFGISNRDGSLKFVANKVYTTVTLDIEFDRKTAGVVSDCLKELNKCKESLGVENVLVEHISTAESAEWCAKHGLSIVKN